MKEVIFTKLADFISPGDLKIPQSSPDNALATVLKIVFTLAGAISVVVITVAGLQMIMSQGNPDHVTKARNAVIYAAIGLAVCVMGYSIVTFVVSKL